VECRSSSAVAGLTAQVELAGRRVVERLQAVEQAEALGEERRLEVGLDAVSDGASPSDSVSDGASALTSAPESV